MNRRSSTVDTATTAATTTSSTTAGTGSTASTATSMSSSGTSDCASRAKEDDQHQDGEDAAARARGTAASTVPTAAAVAGAVTAGVPPEAHQQQLLLSAAAAAAANVLPPPRQHRRPPLPQPVPFSGGGTAAAAAAFGLNGSSSHRRDSVASSVTMDGSNRSSLSSRQQNQMMADESEGGGCSGRNASVASFASSSARSESSRFSLRRDLDRLRASLTPQETNFLEELLISGNEIEVQLAHENLLRLEGDEGGDTNGGSGGAKGNGSINSKNKNSGTAGEDKDKDPLIRIGNERSESALNFDDLSESEEDDSPTAGLGGREASQGGGSVASDGVKSLGSERRQEALSERRKNLLFGKMWKAHQSGLAVTQNSSRRSIFSRQRSQSIVTAAPMTAASRESSIGTMGSSSNSRKDLFRRSRGGDIFRSNSNRLMMGFPCNRRMPSTGRMVDVKSDNARRSSMTNVREQFKMFRHSKSRSLVFEPGRAAALAAALDQSSSSTSVSDRFQPRPLLRRMSSEGMRKSVTFGALPAISGSRRSFTISSSARNFSESEFSAISENEEGFLEQYQQGKRNLRPAPLRQDSNSSIPSLHMAHEIRSPSVTSHSSIPSIHLAHPVRSQSFRSSSGNFSAAAASAISSLGDDCKDPLDQSITSRLSDTQDEKKTDEPPARQVIVNLDGLKDRRQQQHSRAEAVTGTDQDKTPILKNIKRPILTGDASLYKSDGANIEIEKALETPTNSKRIVIGEDAEQSKAITEVELPRRPVLMRDASQNIYQGEGIEVADYAAESMSARCSTEQRNRHFSAARRLDSLVSFGESSADGMALDDDSVMLMLHRCDTFDETMSYGRVSSIFRRPIRRSLSDDDMAGILGSSRFLLPETSSLREVFLNAGSDVDSWMDDESEMDYYDSWKVIEDEYDNGYGGGGTLPFLILGTGADDVDAHPHVLSPPLMESLSAFMPLSKSGDSFWMKYSLVRDGASMHTFLQRARGAKFSFLAVETTDGEVFGAFTTEPWRKNWNYFGGHQSFLWRMRYSRQQKCCSIIDQAQKESEIDVFPFTGDNNCVQLCTHDKIAVGGGDPIELSPSFDKNLPDCPSPIKDHEWGFGLSLDSDLLSGTTSPCITFRSPSLSKIHSDGTSFEIINVELWTLTPCITEEEAEKLELGKLFLEAHSDSTHKLF